MYSLLLNSVNKIVSVGLPTLFDDTAPRLCKLVGVEMAGVWLESDEVSRAISAGREGLAAFPVFIPFVHIAYVAPTSAVSPPSGATDQRRPRRQNAPGDRGGGRRGRDDREPS